MASAGSAGSRTKTPRKQRSTEDIFASHMFVEARAVAGETSQFGILGGMTFHTH